MAISRGASCGSTMAISREIIWSLKIYLFSNFLCIINCRNGIKSACSNYTTIEDQTEIIKSNIDSFRTSYDVVYIPQMSRHICCSRLMFKYKGYFKNRVKYYTNSVKSFHFKRLQLAGDIHSNPGPPKAENIKVKCQVCYNTLARTHITIVCDLCGLICHMKCGGVKPNEYKQLQTNICNWTCESCIQTIFPFHNISNIDESNVSHLSAAMSRSSSTDDLYNLENERAKESKDFMLCHLNINSIQNKIEEFSQLVKELWMHIVFISETKIDSSYPNEQLNIEGYTIYRNDRKKGGGGIMVYVANVVQCKRLKLDKKYSTIESIALEIKIANRSMTVLGIYRPPRNLNSSYAIKLENELSSICNWAAFQNKIVIVLGDLNLDRMKPSTKEGKVLLDIEEEQEFECLINQPTRIATRGLTTSHTLIDVLLTNQPELFKSSGVLNPELSDHKLIYGIMNEKVKIHKNRVINYRSVKYFNIEKYKEDLKNAPWQVGEIFDSIDDKVTYWSTLMTNILDEHAPRCKMRVRERDVPYMTTAWKRAIRAKRRAAQNYEKCKTTENLELKRKLRNEATKQRRKGIKDYWLNKSEALKANPKDFYKTFMPFLGTKQQDRCKEIHLNKDGNLIKKQDLVSDVFCDYFTNIVDGVGGKEELKRNDADLMKHSSIQSIMKHSNDVEDIGFHHLDAINVENVLQQLNPNKATGWDAIPSKFLKFGAKELATPLTTLYNACIDQSEWPEDWKKGEWVPSFKKDDKQIETNYRPITILLTVNKVFEGLLSQQLLERFDSRLSNRLSAHRRRHSCETALIMMTEYWRKALDNGENIGLLSTDMSKVFDSLHHPLMLAKLKAYGLNESSLALFRSYFKDRKNRVRLKQETSAWKLATRGCP